MSKTENIKSKSKSKSSKKVSIVNWEFPLVKKDLIWLAIGVGFVILGFTLMATGITNEEASLPDGTWNNPIAVNVAPFLLFVGYCIVIPMALLKFFTKNKKSTNDADVKTAE